MFRRAEVVYWTNFESSICYKDYVGQINEKPKGDFQSWRAYTRKLENSFGYIFGHNAVLCCTNIESSKV